MPDPIDELYKTLNGEGLLQGKAADPAQFRTNMANPESRKKLYDFVAKAKPDLADMDFASFDKTFAPEPVDGSKKKVGGELPTTSSSSPNADAPTAEAVSVSETPIAGGAPNSLLKEYGSMTGPKPSSEPSRFEAPAQLTGKEDPLAVGGIFRSQIEAGYGAKDRTADKYPWRKGARDLEKITLYGQKALDQSVAAEKQIGERLGKDWQAKMTAYAPIIGQMNDNSRDWSPEDQKKYSEALSFWSALKSDPAYPVWQNGQNAVQKAQQEFNSYADKNPEYAKFMAKSKEATNAADNSAFNSWQNWAGQKLTQIVSGVASLPRTVIGTVANTPASGPGGILSQLKGTAVNKWAQEMGDWADGAMEYAAQTHPTGSGTKRPLWEKVADFQGVGVVVDDQGQPVKAYKDNVEVPMDDKFVRDFTASNAGAKAENKFTGIKNGSMKLADVVSDLYLMRYLGGGTMAGTTAVAFGLQHQNAYQTAIKDLKLTGDEASTYAMVSAGLSAVIEATVGNIETAPLKLATAKALGMKEAKSLVGKASIYDVAKAAWKPYLREIGMENAEELLDTAMQTMNNQMFNSMTGSKLDTQVRPEDIAETIVMTTLATAIAGGGDALRNGKGELYDNALQAAVLNPEAYNKVLAQLEQGGVISTDQVASQQERIARLADINARLPETMDEEQRREIIALEDRRSEIINAAAGTPSEAQQKAAKQAVTSIDTKIASAIQKPAEETAADAPAETPITEDVIMAEDPVVAENATVETPAVAIEPQAIEPVAQPEPDVREDRTTDPLIQQFNGDRVEAVAIEDNPFDTYPTQDRIGEARLVTQEERVAENVPNLAEVAPGRDVTIAQAQSAFQGDVASQALVDDATNLALNSMFPAQRKAIESNPGALASLQNFIEDNLNDESFADMPIRDAVESMANEFVQNFTGDKPETRLSRRLEPVTVQDRIALAFAEGVKVRPQDLAGDIADIKGKNGIRVQYTSRNGTPLDLLAQDIREAMGDDSEMVGMQDQDVRNEILAFINDNPNGPGNYMRDTIAKREQTDMTAQEGDVVEDADVQAAVEVQSKLSEAEESELAAFIASYNGDMDQLLNDWENWDPFYPASPSMERINELSPNIISVLDEKLNNIRTDQGTGKTVSGSEAAVLENESSNNGPIEVGGKSVDEGSQKTPDQPRKNELDRLPEDGPEVLPTPVVAIEKDGVVVTNATAFADLLSDAGGEYDPARNAWVFPADQADVVNEILSRRRTGGDPFVDISARIAESSGISGQVAAILTTPGATLKRARTKQKLKAATSFEDRLAIAQAQHNISRARDERTNRRALKRLKAAFPNIEVITDIETIDKVKRQLGITKPTPGFNYEGKVYVDPRYARPTTAIHEYGHVWNTWLKENDPEMYQRGLELARQSDQFEAVKSNPDYAYLQTEEGQLDEVVATAIGERGALLGDTNIVLKFRRWLSDIWSAVQRAFGYQPRFMTLQEFGDHHAAIMLSGNEVMPETSRRIKQLEDQRDSFGEGGDKAMVDRYNAAVQLEQRGASDEEVFLATGWVRADDGKWRWGIDSKTFSMKVDEQSDIPEDATLADIVDWPALWEAYPNIAAFPVSKITEDVRDPAIIHKIQELIIQSTGVKMDKKATENPTLQEKAPEEMVVLGESDVKSTPKLQVATNASDYAARMETARELIGIEIGKDGLRDMENKIKRISGDLNLDMNHVRRIWESETTKAGLGRLVLDKNDLNQPERKIKDILRQDAKIKSDRRKRFLKRKFNTTKSLPEEIFEIDEKRLGAAASQLKAAAYLQADLETEMEKEYTKPTEAHWRHVDNVMRGEGDWSTLPEGIRNAAMAMRKAQDNVSRELIRAGVMDGEVVLTVLQNSGVKTDKAELEDWNGVNVYEAVGKLPFERSPAENAAIDDFLKSNENTIGNYFYRSYQIHDDPQNWKNRVDPRTMAEARRALLDMYKKEMEAVDQARTDKESDLTAKIDAIQSDIDSILDGLQGEIEAAEQKVKDLEAKQKTAIENTGTRNKTIDKSLGAAAKAFRALEKRAREGKRFAADDIEALAVLDDPDFQNLSVAAKMIVRRRRDIMDLRERIENVQNYKEGYMEQLQRDMQNVDGKIYEILEKDENPSSQVSRSKLGAKDLNILKKRKDIPQAIRDLMGEYHDPRVNFAKSMLRSVTLLENQKFLSALKENFAGTYFLPPTESRVGFVEISSKGSETMSPLNGWKTTPEILYALNNYFGAKQRSDDLTSQVFDKYMKVVAGVKYGKTILSIDTHARNFFGNTAFLINNAYNPFEKKALLAFKDVWTDIKDGDARDYLVKLTKLRVIGNSSHLGSLRDLVADMNVSEADRYFQNPVDSAAKKARKVIEETYGAEDDFFKIIAFETEKARYANAWYGRPFNELSMAQQEAVEQNAAKLVRDLMPTYSMIPEIVKDLNRLPLVATFVAFSSEMFRVTWNQYQQIGRDLSDPRTRGIGMKRLIGAAIMQGAMTAGLTAIGYLRSGIDWEEDKAARRFMLPWQKFGAIVYDDYEPGSQLRFINSSYTNPYAYQTKPLAALFLNWGKTWEDKFGEAVWTLAEPFLSSELTANTLGQLKYNTNERTGLHIYNPGMGMIKDWWSVVKFLGWNLQPGISKKVIDTIGAVKGESMGGRPVKTVEDIVLGTVGLQVERMDMQKSVRSQFGRHKKGKQYAREYFSHSQRDYPNDPEGLKQLFDTATIQYNDVLKDTRTSVDAARVIGLTDPQIFSLLKDQGFSETERAAIMTGTEIIPKFEGYNK